MEPSINFKGYLTFEDSLTIQKAVRKQYPFLRNGLLTLAILGITAFLLSRLEISLFYAILMMLFLGMFMAIVFRVMQVSAKRSQKQAYAEACVRRTGTLDSKAIKVSRNQNTTRITWDRFDRMIERDGIVAIVKDKDYLGFAAYMFTSESDWKAAQDLIARQYER